MGAACCAWSFPPVASLLLLKEVPQLPLSLCFTSHSHKTVTRPPCVGPALPRVGNGGHFWGVNLLEGVWQPSELQACARSSGQRHAPGVPVGRDAGTGDAGAGGGSVLDAELVCPSVAKQKPQASSRGLARGAAKVRGRVGGCICAGPCWGTGPRAAASPSGPKATSATCPCLSFPICAKPGGDIFPEMLSKEVACCWGEAQEWQSWGSCAPRWGCPRVLLTVEWLQRSKRCCSPQGAGQHLALPHQHPPEHR